MDCGDATCSIGYSSITSFSIGWSASATAFGWISGGFAVEKSVETGQQYNCEKPPGSYLAVWKKVGQTAYTVQNADVNQCTGSHPRGNPYVMWSPNANNRGIWFYCVTGHEYVRWLGDQWLDTDPGMPGGPWVWG